MLWEGLQVGRQSLSPSQSCPLAALWSWLRVWLSVSRISLICQMRPEKGPGTSVALSGPFSLQMWCPRAESTPEAYEIAGGGPEPGAQREMRDTRDPGSVIASLGLGDRLQP